LALAVLAAANARAVPVSAQEAAGSAATVAATGSGSTAAASGSADYWFAGTRLVFDRPQTRAGGLAVATDDGGLARFLAKLGATISYQPGQSYIVVSSADRRTITFTVGSAQYGVAGSLQTAAFAPYASGRAAYLPFAELARALYVDQVADGTSIVLQPQLAALDVRTTGRATVLTFRGASPLHFRRTTADDDEHLTLAFTGIATTLEHDRRIASAVLQGIAISANGTPRNPTTVVDFEAAPGVTHALVPSDSPNAVSIAFGAPGVTLGGTPVPAAGDATVATLPLAPRDPLAARDPRDLQSQAAPAATASDSAAGPAPAPQTAETPTATGLQTATVTDLRLDPAGEALGIELGVAGAVTYEWHRLSDNRWYVDLKPATLGLDPQTVPVQSDAVRSLRIKGFLGPSDRLPTVRVALTLATPRIVDVRATDAGLQIAVNRLDDLEPAKSGMGEIAGGKLIASIVPLPPPAPDAAAASPDGSAAAGTAADGSAAGGSAPAEVPPPDWKFAPQLSAGVNPRLIVIDPGHGGSDRGAMHNGLTEASLNLDISKRLQTLLIAHGWLVKMTRESDVDVYQPNDSAHDELQARCDIANSAGARLFISIHSNSFTTSELRGTTTYYYKADSYALADAVHARLAADLPTRDDGIRKENFYVIHHTNAPSILVETAFVSNPGDAQLLHSDAFRQKVAVSIANGVGDFTAASSSSDGN
jgi:N-acetylmuramoyl-L-alanine amidase CwlD